MKVSTAGISQLQYVINKISMKKIVLSLLVSCLFFSCAEKNTEVQRISNQTYDVVSDSIYTRMPGTILYQDGIVYWEDPISFEKFVHAVDVKAKSEIASFANMGEGPDDFSVANLSLSPNGGLFINDSNKPLEILYKVDGISVVSSSRKYNHDTRATSLLHLDGEEILYLCPNDENLFCVNKGGASEHSFGERPIKDEMSNAYNVFQGKMAYHASKNMLVYSSFNFPYLSVYKRSGAGAWSQAKELKGDCNYTVSEGKLRFASDGKKGAMELALTDDYIVLLQRDVETEGSLSKDETKGRNVASLPRSLFVYDYDLNLKKIINMPFPMLRLCGDEATNTVYVMSVNPEFELISIEL